MISDRDAFLKCVDVAERQLRSQKRASYTIEEVVQNAEQLFEKVQRNAPSQVTILIREGEDVP